MAPSRISLFLATGLMALAFSHQAAAIRVKGEPVKATAKVSAPLSWRSSTFPADGVTKLGFKDLAPERIVKLQRFNNDTSRVKPLQIGIDREANSDAQFDAMPNLKWQVLKSGAKVARVEITSPDAFGVRVGVRTAGLPVGSELRFSGSDEPNQIIAKVDGSETKRLVDRKNIYWTPGTDGQTQIVEIYLPKGMLAAPVRFDVAAVSHLLINSKESFINNTKVSGTCNVDVVCSTATLGANFVNAKNAVAHIRFVEGGSTFICTGTLLADTVAATQIPYFYTANHCIGDQTVANTISFYFGYEKTTCNGATPALPTPVTGGATLLYTEADTSATSTANGTDASFLKMNGTPPVGAFFAGWDSATLANGVNVTAIHHPAGDPKKVSQGQKKSQATKLQTMGWISGTTEGGSSGSGLFTIGTDGAYYLRGGLYRGAAACSNSGTVSTAANSDDYSRFDVAFPSIQQWLAPAAVNGPTVDHTGAWYNASESGWGVNWFEYPSNGFLGLVFIYDTNGHADWYELGGTWTGTDVRSGPVGRDSGPPFGTSFNPASVSKVAVGTYTMTFTSATTATLTFTIEGVTRTNIPLTKL